MALSLPLDPSGKETLLYTFTGGADRFLPFAGLVRDQPGDPYGTTSALIGPGYGVVFKLVRSKKYAALHTFSLKPTPPSEFDQFAKSATCRTRLPADSVV